MRNKVEILAPAGSVVSMQASFKAGADAVYMGGRKFGARAYAENPEDDGLLEAIDYAHLRGKRLYLTVNTLVKENELGEFYEYLKPLYLHGLDAVIVQDLGVLNMVSRCFPDLPIHISTQMSLTTGEATKQFGSNVTRVVPARELTISEIKSFKDKSGLEMEVFVHGALCYSYSGQCLLSSSCGDRSGNRGRCAQPCRKKYGISCGGSSYIFSPKDICTLDRIPELIEAGVDSFKIEGRMKSPEYACGVTEVYRKAVDLYYELGKEGFKKYIKENANEWEALKIRLADLFNRGGFSEGYAFSKTGKNMMSVFRPNHEGVYVGDAFVKNGYANLKTVTELYRGDVLEIRSDKRSDWYSYTTPVEYSKNSTLSFKAYNTIQKKEKNLAANEKNSRGGKKNCFEDNAGFSVPVFRLRREALLSELNDKYISQKDTVTVNGQIYLTPGSELVLCVECANPNVLTGKNYSVTVTGEEVSEAKSAPLSEEAVRSKVARGGESQFAFDELSVEISGQPFLAKSLLGAIRREALDLLAKEICGDFRRNDNCIKAYETLTCEKACEEICQGEAVGYNRAEERLAVNVFTTTVEQYKAALLSDYSDSVTVDMDSELFACSDEGDRDISELLSSCNKELYLRTFHIADGRKLKLLEAFVKKHGEKISGYYVRNLSALTVLNECKMSGKIFADRNLYASNSEGLSWFSAHGFAGCTCPSELSFRELKQVSDSRKKSEDKNILLEMSVYGREELMISRQCVKNSLGKCNHTPEWLTVTSERGDVYSVYTDCRSCKNRIYSQNPLNLSDKSEEIRSLGIDICRIELTDENAERTGEIIEFFAKQFAEESSGGSTVFGKGDTGHFDRGVL